MHFMAGSSEHGGAALLMIARDEKNAFHAEMAASQLEGFYEKIARTHTKGGVRQFAINVPDIGQFKGIATLHCADMGNQRVLLEPQREGERE